MVSTYEGSIQCRNSQLEEVVSLGDVRKFGLLRRFGKSVKCQAWVIMKLINEHEIPARYILWSNLRQSSQIHATLEALVLRKALKTIYPEGF